MTNLATMVLGVWKWNKSLEDPSLTPVQMYIQYLKQGGNMMKWLILLPAILMLVLVCGSDTLDYQLAVPETRSWPAASINQIEATTVNGNISVDTLETINITAGITRRCLGADSADAADYIDNIVVTDDVASGVLTLAADMPDTEERGYNADFWFSSPDTVYLELNTVTGNVIVTKMKGGANFTITDGNFTSTNMQGGVDGEIANIGNITCDMAELTATESVVLTAENGNIIVSLPDTVSANFDAQTQGGIVIVTGFGNISYTINELDHKAGTIGGGLSPVVLTVTSGNITLQAR